MNYLIVYNHTQSLFAPGLIHNTITNMPGITDWWHYLPNVYIVTSQNDEKYIADKIIGTYPGLLFFVVAVNLNNHNGVLNKNAWEWISTKIKTVLRVKSAPTTSINLQNLLFPSHNLTEREIALKALNERLRKMGVK